MIQDTRNNDAANYRPVSLTCICCKTLEHIIVSNINKHLAFESFLADCQHGFRSQRSCETQLVQFFHDLVSNFDRAQYSVSPSPKKGHGKVLKKRALSARGDMPRGHF